MKYIVITVIVCILITILINRYLKNKYKTDYDTFMEKEKEFNAYRESELRSISEKQEEVAKERIKLLKEHYANQPIIEKSILYDYLKNTLTFRHIQTHDYLDYNRFYYFLRDEHDKVKHDLKSITVRAAIKGSKYVAYQTTLNECNCEDFQYHLRRKEPCKHMYMLAYELALLNDLPLKEIKKELGAATVKYLKAVEEYNKINKAK